MQEEIITRILYSFDQICDQKVSECGLSDEQKHVGIHTTYFEIKVLLVLIESFREQLKERLNIVSLQRDLSRLLLYF